MLLDKYGKDVLHLLREWDKLKIRGLTTATTAYSCLDLSIRELHQLVSD